VKRRQALTRAGARAGDDLYVSGPIGSAAAGLMLLRDRSNAGAANDAGNAADDGSQVGDCTLTTAYLRPEPRVRLGMLLSRNRAAAACVDLSDGLADAVHRIAEASGVGAAIDADAVPIEASARAHFAACGLDAVTAALTGGDDYQLLLAVRPRAHRRLSAAAHLAGAVLTRIGRCQREPDVILQRSAGAAVDRTPLPQGYSHFR
jgi:thiamine-monophosphate kinase